MCSAAFLGSSRRYIGSSRKSIVLGPCVLIHMRLEFGIIIMLIEPKFERTSFTLQHIKRFTMYGIQHHPHTDFLAEQPGLFRFCIHSRVHLLKKNPRVKAEHHVDKSILGGD